MKKLLSLALITSILSTAPLRAWSWENMDNHGHSWQDYNVFLAINNADTKSLKKYLIQEKVKVSEPWIKISVDCLIHSIKKDGFFVKAVEIEKGAYRVAKIWLVCTICFNLITKVKQLPIPLTLDIACSPIFPTLYLINFYKTPDYIKKAERIEILKLLIENPRVDACIKTEDGTTAYDILLEFVKTSTELSKDDAMALNSILSLLDAKMNQQK